jgi:hypothetical protein
MESCDLHFVLYAAYTPPSKEEVLVLGMISSKWCDEKGELTSYQHVILLISYSPRSD